MRTCSITVGLAARALLGVGQVDVDVADVRLALIAVGDRDERRVDLGDRAGLARDALGDQRRRLERRALRGLHVDLELRLVVGRQEVAADLLRTSGTVMPHEPTIAMPTTQRWRRQNASTAEYSRSIGR